MVGVIISMLVIVGGLIVAIVAGPIRYILTGKRDFNNDGHDQRR